MVETVTKEEEACEKKPVDHYNPTVRSLVIQKLINGSCGFNLSRSKWDPYPWVSLVDRESPAEITGLKVGDCVLEVNHQDILGLRIADIANLVRAKGESVSLLLWSSGVSTTCNPESLCCGPMPQNLEKLSASMSTILAAMECPICLDTIPPPVIQCQNGHLICAKCRTRSERCPVCREKYSPGRSLIAEQIYNSLTDAFKLPNNERLRERLFGGKFIKASELKYIHIQSIQQQPSHTQKFLARLMGKASSLENLNTIRSTIPIEDNLKSSKSQSTTELFQNDLSHLRPKVGNLRQPSGNHSLENLQTCRHPSSLLNSTESLINNQITVPQLNHFKCPLNKSCPKLMNSSPEIKNHVMNVHNIPILTFGASSAEIVLPPQQLIENSFLILQLDQLNFWVRLISTDEKFFCSALLEAKDEDESHKYHLEASLVNNQDQKNVQKHLISRNVVYSLQENSWDKLLEDRMGVFYKKEILKSTFNTENLLFNVAIVHS